MGDFGLSDCSFGGGGREGGEKGEKGVIKEDKNEEGKIVNGGKVRVIVLEE